MKKIYWIIIGTVVVGGGLLYLLRGASESKQVSFETANIERGDITMIISDSGTLNAINTVEVGTQVSGVIEKVMVDFNDQVKKGQVIAQIDARNLQSTLAQKKAMVLQAELQSDQKKRAYDYAITYNSENGKDLSIVEAEASLEQVRTQMELSKRNYERYKDLYENGVVSKIDFETKQMDYERFNANYSSAEAMLNRTKANVGNVDLNKSKDDFKNAEASLASAKADLNKASINLDYAIVRAPIDGIVISRNVEIGQTVAASFATPVLFSIANDLTQMEIEASIDEADIGMIKVGQYVVFSVDAYPDESFEGIVGQIRLQPQVISNVVTYTAIISADNAELKLMPGMTANLDVTTAERKNALRVPVAAINFTPPPIYSVPWKEYLADQSLAVTISDNNWKTGILWIVQDNELAPKRIKIGLSDGSYTEISSADLTENDKVVIGLIDPKKVSKTADTNLFMPSRPGAKKAKS